MALNYADYFRTVQSPIESSMQGIQSAYALKKMQLEKAGLEQQQALQAQKLQQAQAMQTDLATLAQKTDATPQDYISMMVKYPTIAESLKAPMAGMTEQQSNVKRSQALNVFSALQAGQTEVATQLLQDNLAAAQNSGNKQDEASAQAMLQLVQMNPEAAKTSAGLFLANTMGADKFAETWTKLQEEGRSQKLAGVKFDKELADLDLTKAQINQQKMDTKRIAAVIGKTNKDAEQVAMDVKLKQLEYQQKLAGGGIDLSTDAEKLINESVQSQVNLQSLSNQYETLADNIDTQMASGKYASAAEAVKKIWGSEDEVTRIRQEYMRLRNSQVLQSLPPGVASDKDIEVAMGVFPSETANPETISSFLRGMSKLNKYDANLNGAKADWVSQVGSLKPTPKDVVIAGKTIPKGTSFSEAIGDIFVPASPIENVAPPSSQQTTTPQASSTQTPASNIMLQADKIISGG
jgi:hypothetical protein